MNICNFKFIVAGLQLRTSRTSVTASVVVTKWRSLLFWSCDSESIFVTAFQ